MSEEKRKRSPILPTIRRAVVLVAQSGHVKDLLVTSLWVLLGAVYSFTAVFNEKFLNAAADILGGDANALKTAMFWLLVWGGVEIFTSVAGVFNAQVLNRMWQEISYFAEESVMKKVCKIRLKYFDDREAQKKIRFVKNGVSGYISSVTQSVLQTLRSLVTFVTALMILVNTNWKIALIVAVTTIPNILLERRRTEKYYELNQWQSYEGQMQRYLALILIKRKYIKEMRFYQLYDYMQKKYDESVDVMTKQQMKLVNTYFFAGLGTSIFTYGAIAISLAMISADIFAGTAQIGAFVLVYNSVRNMQNSLMNVFNGLDDVGNEGRYLEDYETVMNFEEEDVSDIPSEEDAAAKARRDAQNVEITFDHVSFAYPGMDNEVIKDLSLTIKPGEKIAIVGENGSGKSTFVSLLTGLYSPTKGRILVNGEDISKKLGFMRDKLSCTMQDFLQHQETLGENVRIGDLRHEHTEEEIRIALKKADMTEFVDGMAEKEETYLGNLHKGSTDLSGGQWQKLAMARNLLKDTAKIMLMDEPTAALDPLAESRLYREFSNLTQDKTVILISHRLGATRLADRVLVFDDGKVVEDGTHEELLKKKKLYAKMYQAQAQWYVS